MSGWRPPKGGSWAHNGGPAQRWTDNHTGRVYIEFDSEVYDVTDARIGFEAEGTWLPAERVVLVTQIDEVGGDDPSVVFGHAAPEHATDDVCGELRVPVEVAKGLGRMLYARVELVIRRLS